MANEPPAPKTHFAITAAKPKGTLADHDAGNLPPPTQPKAPTVATGKRGSRAPRRRPNPPKTPDPVKVATGEALPPDRANGLSPDDGQTPYEKVLADLMFKRASIDAAIAALRELYE